MVYTINTGNCVHIYCFDKSGEKEKEKILTNDFEYWIFDLWQIWTWMSLLSPVEFCLLACR